MSLSEFIYFWIGLIFASIFYYKTDDWRIKRLRKDGYDSAVTDIIKYGYYFNTNNEKVNIEVKEINDENININ